MARPRTPIGSAGHIRVVGQVQNEAGRWVSAPEGVKPERWRARTKFRDRDGKVRDVEAFAPTKGKAETKLKAALAERTTPVKAAGTGGMRADMTVADAARLWLAQVERPESGLADTTRTSYRFALNAHILTGSLGGHTLREANRVPVLRTFLQEVADNHGSGSAKTTRSVMSSILRMAVNDGALEMNAMRDVRAVRAATTKERVRDTTRALTRTEREHLMAVADADETAVHLDVADIVAYMAATGVRIGEALGQQWADVDLDAGTVYVRGTKTSGSDRVLPLAPWLVERLQERAEKIGTTGLLFPSPGLADMSKQRNMRNVHRQFKRLFEAAGYPWATPHTLRRTVASLIDEAGLSIAEAADMLGHKDAAMTMRVYLGRKGTSTRAASVL